MKKINIISIMLLFAMLIVSCSRSNDKTVITFARGDWESIEVNNAISRFIVEKGYGYKTELTEYTWKELEIGFNNGEIDICMEIWPQNIKDWYVELIKKGEIIEIGVSIESAPQFFIIPSWVSEKYNIKTIFDMKENWQLFSNPENSFKGLFHNGPIGWDLHDINVIKLKSYGLHKYYDFTKISSSEALDEALIKAQENHQPVFGFYWAPTALIGSYDWYVLKEPEYNSEIWKQVQDAQNTKEFPVIETACAYPDKPILIICNNRIVKKAPDLFNMYNKMIIGLDPLNKTLAWIKENDVKLDDREKIAIYYLKNFENRWKEWVSKEAYIKLKGVLEKMENS